MELLFVVVFIFFFLLMFGLYALMYVGQALGTYRMMCSAGLPHTWTAWVPGCNVYALGALADHQTIRNEGKDKKYRKKLVIWTVAFIVFCVVFFAAMIVILAMGVPEDSYTASSITRSDAYGFPREILLTYLFMIPLYALEIIYMVYYYIVLYKIYKLFSPDSAAGLTVLSVFVSVAVPIILFVLSKRQPVYENDGAEDYDFMPPPEDPEQPSNPGRNIYSQ